MATVDECRQALGQIAARLASDPETAARVSFDRTVACHVRDLDVHFRGRLSGGAISDITEGEDSSAQIRLAMSGDDLLALAAGTLHIASAWASGRVSVKASVTDLLKLRKLL
jgi:hypothetical protein